MIKRLAGPVLLLLSVSALADAPADFTARYAAQAGVAASTLSPARGEAFYRLERAHPAGAKRSCAGCHSVDPRQAGRTRVGKRIEPLAPVVNGARFTDAAKVEKWFRRNCMDVLQRECSAQEKGDFVAWLSQLK
ncbi:cytochrome c'' [Thiobacillus denitrificans ATCC 25259]|uniref:Cytochrome c n=1 Tax=Thiobacillus denitrificans (strain ATCC 25259 / T1) TaxID=292415 RepID=Q3SMF4_THIDA|nr:DUF1924 domain-containing protein [Thiobacillus denitrificans]AAZ96091.1 cytochrome c'' [Thiobacillus denitrificans ATCC 25259]